MKTRDFALVIRKKLHDNPALRREVMQGLMESGYSKEEAEQMTAYNPPA